MESVDWKLVESDDIDTPIYAKLYLKDASDRKACMDFLQPWKIKVIDDDGGTFLMIKCPNRHAFFTEGMGLGIDEQHWVHALQPFI